MSGTTDAVVLPVSLLLFGVAEVAGLVWQAGCAVVTLQREYKMARIAADEHRRAEKAAAEERLRSEDARQLSLIRSVKAVLANAKAPVQSSQLSAKSSSHSSSSGSAALSEVYASLSVQVRSTRLTDHAGDTSASPYSINEDALSVIRAICDDIEKLGDLLTFSLPNFAPWGEVKDVLSSKLDDLRRLATSQPLSAKQAVIMLRQRIERVIQDYSESRIREQAVEELEPRFTDTHAMLAVVASHAEYPDLRQRADRLSVKLHDLRNESSPKHAFLRIAGEVETLVGELFSRHAGDEIADFVRHNVKDVLLSMGYAVKEVPAQCKAPSCVTSIVPGLGVEFSVQENGLVTTEMVSLSDDRSVVHSESAEKAACDLAGKVYGELRERNMAVHEGRRTSFQVGDRLRKVNVKTQPGEDDNRSEKLHRSVD